MKYYVNDSQAEELHEQCLEAVRQCPQCDVDSGVAELVGGKSVVLDDLPKGVGALERVARYWSSPNTIGGSLLWENEYCILLSAEAFEFLERGNQR